MKKLVLVRHSDYDEKSANGSLTKKGASKARRLAEELKAHVQGGSVWVFHSDTERAKETAYIVADAFEAPPELSTVLLSDGNEDVNLAGILNLVRAKKDVADVIVLVTHLEVTQEFPEYFAVHQLQGTSFPRQWGLMKGTALVIDCEEKTITQVNDHT